MDVAEEAVPQATAPTGLNVLKVSAALTSIVQKAAPIRAPSLPKTIATAESSSQSPSTDDDDTQTVESTNGNANMDEAIRVTRARLRKSRPEPKS